MASTCKLVREEEMKTSAERFWVSIRDNKTQLDKVLPHVFKSIEILEGDGRSVGSVRRTNYGEGAPVSVITEKIEIVDEANKMVLSSIIDGDLIGTLYNKVKVSVQVIPKGDGSTLKWYIEFEKANGEVPDPTAMMESIVKTFHEIDAILLKA